MSKLIGYSPLALWRDCRAATAIEYAMIAIFIGILLLAALNSIGTTVSNFFMEAASGL